MFCGTKKMNIGFCRPRNGGTRKSWNGSDKTLIVSMRDSSRNPMTWAWQKAKLVVNSRSVERGRIYYDMLDNINVQMRARFDHFGDFHFLGLEDCKKIETTSHISTPANESLSNYANYFDFV